MVHPDFQQTFYIESDSSDYAIGGRLYQISKEGHKEVIAYTSTTLKGNQIGYTVIEKECLALVYCLV